ncbi:hypothetical protein HKO22_02935 [Peptoniphilus sp. AGMB00490]|uniref:Uncharacterized protein n=1 Tax=Peptoniphilus faecalis TaxID=2731255 RepID=A0A848RGZ2_9FIRM|nr:hypothetical protein [Peptoniphilus faecalis]NMW84699.1 hypothetical protein [Peptoniphilus faecalis]
MITQYKFSEDEEMQSIGRELFKNGNHIAESRNPYGRRVLSFLVIEEGIYRVKNEQLMPKNASIVVYPEFDEAKECYNIIITISVFTPLRHQSYDYILCGETKKQKLEQNHILKALLDKRTVMEIWFRGSHSTLSNWIAPVNNTDIFHEELLKKIIKWNNLDNKKCSLCGKEINKANKSGICGDCHSKQVITKNRKK